MPRIAICATAGVQCLACSTMDLQRVHTCKEAEGQRGIRQVEVRPGTPPSKTAYMNAARDALKKQATARQKAGAKPFKAGVAVSLPRRVKPSTEKEIKDFLYPERWGGPLLTQADRKDLAKIVARAYWSGGFIGEVNGLHNMVAAFLAAKVVVEPWKCDWFQGCVDSEADAKKRLLAAGAKGRATLEEASEERFDEDVFAGMSQTHAATYQRLAKKIANQVADRDNKPRPSPSEIWKNPCYSVRKSNFGRLAPSTRLVDFHTGTTGSTSRTARATPAPAACGSSAVDTAACAS